MKDIKYPWEQAPAWAKWAATDRDGQQWWYQNKPKRPRHYSQWVEPTPGSEIKSIGGDYPAVKICPHWRDTLQARPAKPKRTAPARGKERGVTTFRFPLKTPKNMRCNNCGGVMLQSGIDRMITKCRCGMIHNWAHVKLPVKRAGARV